MNHDAGLARTAVLEGTRRAPVVRLNFPRGAKLPWGTRLPRTDRSAKIAPPSSPPTVTDLVRRLPGRRWDPERSSWVATALGPDPDGVLEAAGFTVDLGRGQRAGVRRLADLMSIWIELDTADSSTTHVYPRLLGRDGVEPWIPASARWVPERGRFEVRTGEMAASALPLPADVAERAKELAPRLVAADARTGVAARAAAAAESLEAAGDSATITLLREHGRIPAWFGVTPYPYQEAGIYAMLSGHSVLCDEPGLGKTIQALGVIAVLAPERSVIVVPPVVLTNWRREIVRANLAVAALGARPSRAQRAEHERSRSEAVGMARTHDVATIMPGRKVPALPERGIVVVGDSMLSARPALLEELMAWAPEVFVLDEAHRTQSWDSNRSAAMRRLAAASGRTFPMTGTPFSASPVEMATMLDMSGHLDQVFGGLTAFLETYCLPKDKFGRWKARKKSLPGLSALLYERVWTRRTKEQVLPDLPKKTRHGRWLDVDLAVYRAAHAEVRDKVGEWVTTWAREHRGQAPSLDVAQEWSRGQASLVTMLRVATGLTKIAAAGEIVADHVRGTHGGVPGIYARPLIVWVHHRAVAEAMIAEAERVAPGAVRVIAGATSPEDRGRITAEFQEGRVAVLVASIAAAGVGITLTAGCDAMFVETDWNPQLVVQAEDRQARIGQTRPVTVTTLLAEGTRDEHVQAVLNEKREVLEQVLAGGDLGVSVLRDAGREAKDLWIVLEPIVREALEAYAGRR